MSVTKFGHAFYSLPIGLRLQVPNGNFPEQFCRTPMDNLPVSGGRRMNAGPDLVHLEPESDHSHDVQLSLCVLLFSDHSNSLYIFEFT